MSDESDNSAEAIVSRARELAGKPRPEIADAEILAAIADGTLMFAEVDDATLDRCIQTFGISSVLEAFKAGSQEIPEKPPTIRQRITRVLADSLGSIAQLAFGRTQLVAAGLITIVLILLVPPVVQRVRANAFVETAAATHRNYLQGNLPMEIHTSSPAAVTAWFAGKVPFHFQLPDSQQPAKGGAVYQLTGSRLVNFRGSHAALTTYQMQELKISLLVVSDTSARAEGGEVVLSGRLRFHYRSIAGFTVITWSNHGLTYALVSSLPGSARQSCLVCHQDMADRLKYPRP